MDIAIICPISDLSPTYSLTSIIKSQCSIFYKHRHRVHLIVNEDFSGAAPYGATLLKLLPTSKLVDYKSKVNLSEEHEEFATKVAQILTPRFVQYNTVITHDVVFTGWMLPYALGLMSACEDNTHVTYYHWVHSYPSTRRDWWSMSHYSGNHFVVYPNQADIEHIKEVFSTENVIYIPHIVDYGVVNRFSDQAKEIVNLIPALYSSDLVQIYPAATDRFEGKGVRELTNLFGLLKKSGKSVCLVIANQFSGRRSERLVDPVYYYEKVARRCGLVPYTDYIFTSELFNGKYKDGLPQKVLFELMTLANLFVIPSKSESFGLGLLEALIAGGVICVANEHLNLPITQHTSFDFKTFSSPDQFIALDDLSKLSDWIINELDTNLVVKTKSLIRQDFNPISVYNNYYKPILFS